MSTNNPTSEDLVTDAQPTPSAGEENEFNDRKSKVSSKRKSEPKPKSSESSRKTVTNVVKITNSKGIHFGPTNYIVTGSTPQSNGDQKSQVKLTEEISQVMCSNDLLTVDMIDLISTHIGENWRSTVRDLEYSEGQIFQFYDQYHQYKIKEVVYQILNDWMQNKPNDCKVGTLATALWKSDEKDVVQRLAIELSKLKCGS